MRKILYSPGFGAGWVSWQGGEGAEFMLEYQPIIEFLEAGGEFREDPKRDYSSSNYLTPWMDFAEGPGRDVLERFCRDWHERYHNNEPGSYPYLGGARDLRVASIPDGAKVRITEYDGNESYEIEGETEGWL